MSTDEESADRSSFSPAAVEGLAATILYSALYAGGLLDSPWWALAVVLVVLNLVGIDAVERWLLTGRLRRRLQLDTGLRALCSAALIYLTGWGSLLVPGFIVLATGSVRLRGGRIWRAVLAWSSVALLGAQTAVWTGAIETDVPTGLDTAAFVMGITVVALFTRGYGQALERLELETNAHAASEARFRSLVQNSHEVVVLTDGAGQLSYASPAARAVMGHAPDRLLGHGLWEMIHPDDRQQALDTLARASESDDPLTLEVRGRHGDGSSRWWEVVLSNRLDDPAVCAVLGNIGDVTDRRTAQEQLIRQATRDALTGLLNRSAFLAALNGALARARRTERLVGLLFLDLDNFKLVNDTWGHNAGDQLLRTVASRLVSAIRGGDQVARFTGDEFIVLLEDVADHAEVSATAERVKRALSEPVMVAAHRLQPSASIGIGISIAGRESADELIRTADLHMYEARPSITPPDVHTELGPVCSPRTGCGGRPLRKTAPRADNGDGCEG